jgi:tetratricopeptide (TPR) repeat protein
MRNEEKILTVARYLEDDMELQEKREFEILLQTDVEMQHLLTEYKNVHQTLKMKIAPAETDRQVEATLASLNKAYFKTEGTGKEGQSEPAHVVSFKPYLKWMSVAAVLVIGLFVWAPWRANLYDQYRISKEMSIVERGESDKNNVEKAAAFYNAHDFVAAGKILEKEYLADAGNALVAYYYGITLIESSKEDKARAVLSKLYQGESVFKYDAAYYISLSFVKQNNHPKAIEWLQKIPQESSGYDKAHELIRALR